MATLDNDRIYFFGGSRPIPITSPAWNQTHQYLSAISRMPFRECHLDVKGEQQYYEIVVWDTNGPGTYGPPLPRRRSTATVIDKNGVIYIFGGRMGVDTGGVTQYFSGGLPTRVSMNEHTIDIFGGTQGYFRQSTSYPTFVLLDVKSEPFQYSSPQTSGMAPPPLSYHLYQNYMIVAFGVSENNVTNDFGPSSNTSADIYIMKLLNYTWVTQFEKASSSNTNHIKLITIISSVVDSAVIIVENEKIKHSQKGFEKTLIKDDEIIKYEFAACKNIRPIEKGGFSTVYSAVYEGKKIALKSLDSEEENKGVSKEFIKEVMHCSLYSIACNVHNEEDDLTKTLLKQASVLKTRRSSFSSSKTSENSITKTSNGTSGRTMSFSSLISSGDSLTRSIKEHFFQRKLENVEELQADLDKILSIEEQKRKEDYLNSLKKSLNI
ncbi:43134_t:CDS:10 [Gigaspora margarita]|uniref:43134_t:CDS:1 n=1 Tax=Gigaspora margarita TaxID=4874 RepID=A0ABM8VXI1_GIGMA|nr:43134_t:CDS:10 [Gigaspora margarita]